MSHFFDAPLDYKTMNTHSKQLVAVSLLFAILSINVIPARAGILDWIKSDKADSVKAGNASFDELYASFVATGAITEKEKPAVLKNANSVLSSTSPIGGTGKKTTIQTITVQLSGYNSEVAQTDDSPFITAANTHVRDGIVAANVIDANGRNLPFGTRIKIPSLYGDKIFVVEDRMNRRYTRNVDIWFESKAEALKLGRRTVTIQVIK